VALQRCKGWGECRCRLSATRAASRSCAALRGHEIEGPGRVCVAVRPVRRFNALRGDHPSSFLPAREPGIGPPCAFVLLQRRVPAAPQRSASHRFLLQNRRGWQVPRCSLSWALVPYDTIPDRRTRMKATNPSAAACRVRGLATPFATYTTDPPGARSAGASMGLTLQGIPLVRERCSSRSPCPPDVAGRTTPRGGRNGSGRLQGLVPATSPCSHRNPEGNRPSIPSWG
jgi:hypothetical protein